MYGVALRASVAKSWEFASFVHRSPAPTNGFFLNATLRGICEDLIAFSFLDSLPPSEREKAISLLMLRSTAEGITAQEAFFRTERPWQPVLRGRVATLESSDAELRELSKNFSWTGKQVWPTVWFVAKATSLIPIYNYLYSATSRWVHFSPHLLIRMGWGGSADDLGANTKWHFTTENFSRYYTEFNRVYSVYLLVRLLRGPAIGLTTNAIDEILTNLEGDLSEVIRWPEVVTFEEMNIKGPPQLLRLLLWAGYTTEDRDSPALVGASLPSST